ncbi:DUF4209 domain-containing protein [Kluyvera sichuanensis]|uniref:DUF4209 domain-containing protein n=1 Tax=Kluyvera sichuanensis TaxID=2725494 RepID=UPI0039F6D534
MQRKINEDVIEQVVQIINTSKVNTFDGYSLRLHAYNNFSVELESTIDFFAKVLNAKIDLHKRNTTYIDRESNKVFSEIIHSDDLVLIEDITSKITILPLRARLLDFLWLYKKGRNIIFAYEARRIYSSFTINADNWYSLVRDSYQRCLRLPKTHEDDVFSIGVENKVLDCFFNTTDDFLFCEMTSFITKTGIGTELFETINKKIRKKIIKFKEKRNYRDALICLDILYERYKNDLYNGDGDYRCQLVNIAQARVYNEEGEKNVGLIAISSYKNALKLYQSTKVLIREKFGVANEIERLKAKIRHEGKIASESMVIIKSDPFDISDEVNKAINHVTDKPNILVALVYFCFVTNNVSKRKLVERCVDSIKRHPISHMFSNTVIDAEGRIVGSSMGVDIDDVDPDNLEKIIIPLTSDFSYEISYKVKAFIIPALDKIIEQHFIDFGFIKRICTECAFIAPNKKMLFSRALMFGLEGDYATSVHLLAPLIEDTIRKILYDFGDYTAIIERNAKSTEVSINTLLSKDSAKDIFDEDFIFELKMLLTNPNGPNLRNTVAHGMLDDDTSQSVEVAYFWWRILRWVILSVVMDKDEYIRIKSE